MTKINRRVRRRRTVAGAVCAVLAFYAAGYLLSCHSFQLDDCGPPARARRYRWKWEIPFYAAAAEIESACLGMEVWIGLRSSNAGGQWHNVPRRAWIRLLPFPPDADLGTLRRQNTQVIEVIDGQEVLKVPVVLPGSGNVANYSVQLEQDLLHIGERDDNTGLTVGWGNPFYLNVTSSHSGGLDVHRKPDGAAAWHVVRFPKARYLDLNGDGVFDALADYRLKCDDRLFILLEDRIIEVKRQGRGPGATMREAESREGTRYRFDVQGVWRAAARTVQPHPYEYHPSGMPPREALGPEWTKVQIPNTQMLEYRRELHAPVDRAAGNVTNYSVRLEADELHIGEFDDKQGFFVRWHDESRVDVRRHRDGSPAWHQIQFPNARYLDLNGDGIFDVFTDFRLDRNDGQRVIVFDDQFIPVKGSAQSLSETMRTAETADGTAYVFEGDKWRMLTDAADLDRVESRASNAD